MLLFAAMEGDMDWLQSTAAPWIALFGFVAAVMSAGATGALFKPGAWYRTLSKPVWTPPDWLFPIAWSVLYICMSVAVWWVAMSDSVWSLPAVALWCWQVVLNGLWSPVFFGLRRIGAAVVVIAGLWIAVALTTLVFFRVSPLAGWLMAPYLFWVSYAGALNVAVWRRNRALPTRAPRMA